MWSYFTSHGSNYVPPIRPELIHMALNNGIVADDDYLARSYNTLPDIVTELPEGASTFTSDDALPLNELNEILAPPSSLPPPHLEHGFVRLSDWTWYLACKTNLRNCNGEMFDWWFNHCDCTERFRWSHPLNNVEGGEYDPSFYAVQPEDRLPGHYIGHTFSGKRILNGFKHRFHIDYVNPIDYLDTSKFSSCGITACVAGQLYVVDKDFGEIFLGHIVHVVIERGVGSNELISRMWLGHIDKQHSFGFPPPSFVNYYANSAFYRYFGLTTSWARTYWTHLVQEMGCIANLLPIFYPIEIKQLQYRKENFPNGLVLDEVKNHLRNLELENPFMNQEESSGYQRGFSSASASSSALEYKSNELPRPLTVYTGLEPWETLGGGESDGNASYQNDRGSGHRLSHRNTSLRQQQHQQVNQIKGGVGVGGGGGGGAATSQQQQQQTQQQQQSSNSNLQQSSPKAINQRLQGKNKNARDVEESKQLDHMLDAFTHQQHDLDDDDNDSNFDEGEDPQGVERTEYDQHPGSATGTGAAVGGGGRGGGGAVVSYATNELGGGVDI